MLHLIGFLFIFALAILLAGAGLIAGLVRSLFGFVRGKGYGHRPFPHSGSNRGSGSEERGKHSGRRKIFTKDDGEYVDFEEVE